MASFFKNLFRKDEEGRPVPALPLTNGLPSEARRGVFQENGDAAPAPMSLPVGRNSQEFVPTDPFSAASGGDMTARQVAAPLPPALLGFDGIGPDRPDQPTSLPIASLRESMEAGRPVFKLSQIHDAGPAAFQRAPLPHEASATTLSLARVTGILEFSAPVNPMASPAAAPPKPPPTPAPAANPFAAISPVASLFAAASPFTTAPAAGGAGTGSLLAQAQGPLSAAIPPALQPESRRPSPIPENKAPSQPVSLATVDLGLRAVLRDVDPAALGFASENVPESVRVALPLTLVSRQLAGGRVEVGLEELCAGIAEKFRPAFARAREGLRITIPLSEVFPNLPESARPALAPVQPAGAHRAIRTSPFQTSFAIKAQEDSNRQLLALAAAVRNASSLSARPAAIPVPEPVLLPAPLPLVHPAAGAPPAVQVELPVLRPAASAPSFPANPAITPPPLTPRPGMLSRPPGSVTAPTGAPQMPMTPPCLKSVTDSPAAPKAFPKPPAPPSYDTNHGRAPVLPSALALPGVAELPSAEPADDLGESFSAATLSAEPPPRAGSAPVMLGHGAIAPARPLVPIAVPEPVSPGPFESSSGVREDGGIFPETTPLSLPTEAPAPAPDPVAPAPATSPLEDLTFGCNSDVRQLTLRAVLGADRILTPQEIVDRCAALSGLKACVLLQPHATLTSQGMDAGEADAFRASAAKTRDSLATLAETMGLGRSGNFTLRTDHGIRSFFLEANLCLAVWHAQPQFSGGTREKLILIAQELARS